MAFYDTEFNQVLFGEKIAVERIIIRKISQRQAAEEIGISVATLCRFELGRTFPDVLSYYRVCQWLKCELEVFFISKKI